MNIQQRIAQLERQRTAELRTANFLFVRTKRDLRRKLSPDRAVRKHIGVAIGLAAIAGMVLAPAPRSRPITQETPTKPRRRGSAFTKLAALAATFVPALRPYVAGADALGRAVQSATPRQPDQKPKDHSRLTAELLLALAPIIGTKLDWQALMDRAMQELQAIMGHHARQNDAPAAADPVAATNSPGSFGPRIDDPEDGD